MKFLYLIAHDNLKNVKKRAIWLKHDSNKPQIPDTERDFPRRSLLCNLLTYYYVDIAAKIHSLVIYVHIPIKYTIL